MKRIHWPKFLCLLLVVSAPGLASDVPDGFAQVVIAGTNSVELRNGSQVTSGDVVVNDAAVGNTLMNGVELGLGTQVTVAGNLAADRVAIGNGSSVAGDVATNDLDNDGTIAGSVGPLTLPVFDSLPPFESATPSADDVSVGNGGAVSLSAGDYGALTIGNGGTVTFEGGDYSFASIDAQKDAVLAFDAGTRIRVAGRMIFDKNATIGGDVAAADVLFFVAAVSGGGNPRAQPAIDIGKDSQIGATFYAPNGTIRIGQSSAATGAFVARDVLIELGATVALDSAFNEAPVAEDDSTTVDEGGVVSVLDGGEASVLANDSDPNPGDLLFVTETPVSGPDFGTLTLAADGTFTYAHDGSDTLADAFVYEVCDDGVPVHCATATVSITVNPVNDPPVAVDDSAETDEDMAVSIDVLANDSDVDGTLDPSSVTVTSGPSAGTTSVDAGTGAVTYTPTENFFGSDSFTYEVCDDGGLCASATVSVTVNAVNDPPTIRPDQAVGNVDEQVVVFVLNNDDDPDGLIDPTSLQITSSISNGTAVVSGDTIVFTPDTGFTGTVTFTYQVCDDGTPPPVLCGSAAVRIEIVAAGENRPPIADDSEEQTDPGVAIEVRMTATDADGDELSFSIATSPSQGVLGLVRFETSTSATVTYTPDDDASGSDAFTFLVDDGNGGTDVGTVTIAFGAVNRRPQAVDDFVIVAQGDTVDFLANGTTSVLGNDSDPDGDGMLVDTVPVSGPDHGSLSLFVDGTFSYTHDGGFDIEDAFVYEVCDTGIPQLCDTATVVIEIRQVTIAVTIQKAGDGTGRVVSSPSGIDCGAVCTADFAGETRISLDATADEGSEFVGWSGDADCDDADLRGLADTTCVATFAALPPPADTATLTIVKEGAGFGTVVSNPSGIICGTDCSVAFLLGSTVALLVRPDPGSTFAGWSGDPDCADGMVTMTGDLTCIATFE